MSTSASDTYAFVDGGQVRHHQPRVAREWFGAEAAIDPNCFRGLLGAQKVFYYDSVPEQEKGESTEDYKARVARQEELFRGLKRAHGTHVREGVLAGGKKTRQKQVDILLAVDAMTHAVRDNMKTAVLLTGDQDFLPLVEALVGLGKFVVLWGDRRATSGALADSADTYVPMGLAAYHRMAVQSERDRLPLPMGGSVDRNICKKVREGTVGGMPAELFLRPKEDWAVVIKGPAGEEMCFTHREQPRLFKFCELEYGPVVGMS